MRHQLHVASGLPHPDPSQRAPATKAFKRMLDDISKRLEGKEPEPTRDAALEKIRRLH